MTLPAGLFYLLEQTRRLLCLRGCPNGIESRTEFVLCCRSLCLRGCPNGIEKKHRIPSLLCLILSHPVHILSFFHLVACFSPTLSSSLFVSLLSFFDRLLHFPPFVLLGIYYSIIFFSLLVSLPSSSSLSLSLSFHSPASSAP